MAYGVRHGSGPDDWRGVGPPPLEVSAWGRRGPYLLPPPKNGGCWGRSRFWRWCASPWVGAVTGAEVVGDRPRLPAAVVEHLVAIPGAADTPGFRAGVFLHRGKLAARMVALERQHAVGVFGAQALAELWAWASYLVVVLGYPADTTVAQYVRSVGRLMAWCEEVVPRRDYAALVLPDFDDWQKWLFITHRNGTDWRTNQLAAARQFYRWRETRGLGPDCAKGTTVRRRGLRMARKYTDEQLRAMLNNAATRPMPEMRVRDRTLMLLLLASGARREELTKLAPYDVDLRKGQGVVLFHGKGAKEREVPLEGPVVDALREWMGVRDALPFDVDPDALFVALRGREPGTKMGLRTVERVIAVHAEACKIRSYGVHRFRVNFATALYDAGHGIQEIRALLGHESIETTQRYIAVSERVRKTRMSAAHQHKILGTRGEGQPLWMRAALGGLRDGE